MRLIRAFINVSKTVNNKVTVTARHTNIFGDIYNACDFILSNSLSGF
jgi:hypothetical protein